MILPDLISKEPLGPSVRRGDDEFFTIVKWVVFALIEAEEYGISQGNVDGMRASSTDPVVQRILGTSEDTGKLLGLDKDWAYRAIKAVGNYGEIFERNVGPKSRVEAAARREQPLEQGRPDVRAAGALGRFARPGVEDGSSTPGGLSRGGARLPPSTYQRRRASSWRLLPNISGGRGAARHFAAWSTRSSPCCSWSRRAGIWSTTRCSTCACAGSRAGSISCSSPPASRSARACGSSTRRRPTSRRS